MKMMIKANEKLVHSVEGLKGLPLLSSHFLQAMEKMLSEKKIYIWFLIS